jgi:hypothetical protein
VTQVFQLRDLEKALPRRSVTPYVLAGAFGFDEADPNYAAVALRIAWPWLSTDEIEAGITALCLTDAEVAAAEQPWRDWSLVLGAVWDVCSVEQAERLFRPLAPLLVSSGRWILPKSLYTTAIRFASRLPERNLQYSKVRTMWAAFGGGVSAPETRTLFGAEATLPEWLAPLSELILEMQPDYNKVDVLEAVADSLPEDLLEQQRTAARRTSGSVRDMVLRPILTSIATRSAEGARRVLGLADQYDEGYEYQRLVAYLEALTVPGGRAPRETDCVALRSLPYDDEVRTHVLSTLAPAMAPWSLAIAKNGWGKVGRGPWH